MHIESVTLTNFRCFGNDPVKVSFGPDVTALIGANGAGKTACLEALRRLFGETRQERTVSRADVHFGPGEKSEEITEKQVVIDAVLAFPELSSGDQDAVRTIPEVFSVMTASSPGQPLKARMRLEAHWRRGESYADEIDAKLYWVTTLDEVAFGEDGGAGLDKRAVQSTDRNKIRLVYVPATRDVNAVTRQALRNLLRRLERSGDFGEEAEQRLKEASATVQETLEGLPAIEWITNKLEEKWGRLHEALHLKTPRLAVLTQDFVQLLRSLSIALGPGPDGRDRGLEELSEGQTSLFFLALSATVAELEQLLALESPPDGFTDLDVAPPALTIYAVEEPENHLAPFYLARLIGLLKDLCKGAQAMGIVTSHSPSVMRRIPPESVQYFRLDSQNLVAHVNSIRLPEDQVEAAKFVRQAVLAHPELYFAKLVILGEGESEEVVIPRVAEALGIDLDPAFVTFAPLGGRHVNHFWRLLSELGIPTLTLLDFDLGRHGGGPLRLKYTWDQLRKIKRLRRPSSAKGDPSTTRYWRSKKKIGIQMWRKYFQNYDVFFSFPIDLDMMMIRAFPSAYAVSNGGQTEISKIEASVFGKGLGMDEFYERNLEEELPSEQELINYEALFKRRSKPASHLKALSDLTNDEIKDNCPKPLRDLIIRAAKQLQVRASEDLVEG